MAKKTAEKRPTVEEVHFRSENAYLCLMLNRRARFIRVIDFRAGALPAKRLFIQSVAQKEEIEKVITLVEKDEVSSWTRVGFVREGQIPGFYKRSDGHLLGCVIGSRTASIEVDDGGVKSAERTINAAKKRTKDLRMPKGIQLKKAEPKAALSARDTAWSSGRGIGGFDPFGRDVQRLFLEVGASRKAKANYISAEYQECFGHALLEILRSPGDDSETAALAAGLQAFADELKRRGIVSAFGFAPSSDVDLATAYLAAGFRKTGLLAKGTLIDGQRKDAILWTRKLANPADGEEAS